MDSSCCGCPGRQRGCLPIHPWWGWIGYDGRANWCEEAIPTGVTGERTQKQPGSREGGLRPLPGVTRVQIRVGSSTDGVIGNPCLSRQPSGEATRTQR